MPKRPAETITSLEGQPYSKAASSSSRRNDAVVAPDMGEFEDAWEDEIESDEDVVDGEATNEDSMEVDGEILPAIEESEEAPAARQVFIPGRHTLEKDEVLEPDNSTYQMLHMLGVDWSSLSFDILKDNQGNERQRYPASAYVVTGTQADIAKNNELHVFKMSSLCRTLKEDQDSDDEDEDSDDEVDEDPILEFRSVPHMGGINRVRAQPMPLSSLPPVSIPYHVATWADTGKVHIWDVRPSIESLETPGYSGDRSRTHKPVFTINAHGRHEGFAMDWATSGEANPSSLRLLTGDGDAKIFLTTTTISGFNVLSQPFTSHASSVEDLQWSPAEPTVFASCSSDCSIRIWDVRVKGRKSALSIAAHPSDVNVISWNKMSSYLLLSGGDEGGIKVWDLRSVQGSSSPAASFDWHRAPITSIEWHPTDDSVFLASAADDLVSLWDLAVEQDDEDIANNASNTSQDDVPPQLLFFHPQHNVKEAHWHPQIPGAIISTAIDGFHIFKTIST